MSMSSLDADRKRPNYTGTCPPSTEALLEEYFEFEKSLLDDDDDETPAALGTDQGISNRPRRTPASSSTCSFKEPHRSRPSFSYLNHASFGDPYASTLELRHHLTNQMCYRQPMVYHRSLVPPLVARAKQRACEYLKINNHDDFSFVNVTGALFSVLRSIQFQEGDIIVTSDMLYHSLVDALLFLSQKYKLKWVQVPTPRGCRLDDIYKNFETCLQNLQKQKQAVVKLLIVDHISSKPSVLFPVDRICRLCRAMRIPTLVDGAHIPGSLPSQNINTEQSGATFYAVTFHKWCNTPRGGASGGLWVNRKDCRDYYSSFIDISALVVHGGWADSNDEANSQNSETNTHCDDGDQRPRIELYLDHTSKPGLFTDGLTQGIYNESTREYENLIVLPHCLDLVRKFEPAFQQHVQSLRWASAQILRRKWDLSEVDAMRWYGDFSEHREFQVSMLSIPLPTERLLTACKFPPSLTQTETKLKRLKQHIVPALWETHGIEVPIFVWKTTLQLGVRLSFGRHVTLEDVEKLGDAILLIIAQGISFVQG